jgi:hypothetical protein
MHAGTETKPLTTETYPFLCPPAAPRSLAQFTETNTPVLVVCATMFVHMYVLGRNSLMLITTGLSLFISGGQLGFGWLSTAATAMVAAGFALESAGMPTRCKLYSLGFLIA